MKERLTFEEIVKQNERRIYYHIHKLNLHDPYKEYFNEGLVAMWRAYESYDPDKGPLATYFNFMIRNRLIDQLRKQNRQENNERVSSQQLMNKLNETDYYGCMEDANSMMVAEDSPVYNYIQGRTESFSDNQKKWLRFYIGEGMSIKEIAEQEGVSDDAVKSWGRQARKRLREGAL
ncbi:sigma-70 family RNA polymerase sigma factor [Virgibacillus halodenitrificans]|nr:sigma-70 family RNA polymerase sigma factor [Virgibacillus halodenitrificans]